MEKLGFAQSPEIGVEIGFEIGLKYGSRNPRSSKEHFRPILNMILLQKGLLRKTRLIGLK